MTQKPILLVCSNPRCTSLYDASWHAKGKAVKIGRRHYCKRECATEHAESLKRGEREQK